MTSPVILRSTTSRLALVACDLWLASCSPPPKDPVTKEMLVQLKILTTPVVWCALGRKTDLGFTLYSRVG